MKNKKIYRFLLISGLILVTWFLWCEMGFNKSKLVFCDVGQGVGVILTKGQFQLIYDTGSDNGKFLKCLSRNIPFWDKKIEAVVISHWDNDHSGSLDDIKKHFQIEKIYANQEINKYKGINNLESGDFLKTNWMEFEVIWSKGEIDPNIGSIVGLLKINGWKGLLMGDVPIEVEQELLWSNVKRDIDLGERLKNVDVMLVGHHGSRNSSSKEWIEYVAPKEAIISVGKNDFGHPSDVVLNILNECGTKIQRTDLEGNIKYVF